MTPTTNLRLVTTTTDPADALLALFERFAVRKVARGAASEDTRAAYRSALRAWFAWTAERGVDAAAATVEDVESYRATMIAADAAPATIAARLVAVRRLFDAIVWDGQRTDNPADEVEAPRDSRAADDFKALDLDAVRALFAAVPADGSVKALRDRALLALATLHGLRTCELVGASVADLCERAGAPALLVHGKGSKDRVVYLRRDTEAALRDYINARGAVRADEDGEPLFASLDRRTGPGRMDRRGVRKVVDGYLSAAGLKADGLSCHALRHTAATLGYKATRDLRHVQAMLGHADPRTTTRYAHAVDRAENNPAARIAVAI